MTDLIIISLVAFGMGYVISVGFFAKDAIQNLVNAKT